MLEELKVQNKVVGYKQSMRALENNTAVKAFVARDADDKIKTPFVKSCSEKDVEIEYADSMKLLGDACDINIKAAVAVITKI